jgi:regulator of replication initiation timing
MWFRFPEGTNGIQVDLQDFNPEVTDKAGHRYFRAPNHFAPKILMLKGFAQVDPPETDLADLPQPDPLRDSAIAQLTKENEALKLENQHLRSDLIAATARITALTNDRTGFQSKIAMLEEKLQNIEEDAEDKPKVK